MAGLASDLREVAALAARPGETDELLDRALDAMASLLPYDLAAFLELRGSVLSMRRARGALAGDELERHTLSLGEQPMLQRLLDERRVRIVRPGPEDAGLFGDAIDVVGEKRSLLIVPVAAGEREVGVLVFVSMRSATYRPETVELATVYGHLIGLGVSAARQAEELEEHQQALQEQNRLLVEEVAAETDACRAMDKSASKPMRRLVQMAKQVAVTDAPVLITGETGTGKEVLARAIHGWSHRAEEPFIQINCAALPENLIESELFGHTKGAFSGAEADRRGRFRLADGGSLLLDEVGDLPAKVQVKLLRVLQEGCFEPVGSDATVQVDVRVLAATNVDLERAIERGRFREDLYYRLHVFPLEVPPLRERVDDLPVLVEHLLERIGRDTGQTVKRVSDQAMGRLREYEWPGNVRELENALIRAAILARGSAIGPDHLALGDAPAFAFSRLHGEGEEATRTLDSVIAEHVQRVLRHTEGNKSEAARVLEISRSRLSRMVDRYDLEVP
ncbi:MAG TPA: sigma 54-interacting transcriptional regulator [Longimicrobiales bacterium]|nr:sigma 54-interacting transcriptional regulator [Longimicrobiales bacterium]